MVYSLSCSSDILQVHVLSEVHLTTDLAPLYDLVRTHIACRQTEFEVDFPEGSFFYSHHLAVLLKCAERVQEAEGKFVLVNPGEELRDALAWIDPARLVKVVFRSAAERVPA